MHNVASFVSWAIHRRWERGEWGAIAARWVGANKEMGGNWGGEKGAGGGGKIRARLARGRGGLVAVRALGGVVVGFLETCRRCDVESRDAT